MLVVLLAPTGIFLLHLLHCVLDCDLEGGGVISDSGVNFECPAERVDGVVGKHLCVLGLFSGNDIRMVGFLGGTNLVGHDGFAVDLMKGVSIGGCLNGS